MGGNGGLEVSRERRRAMRQKVGSHTSICVVCSKAIPRRQKAAWAQDKWTGQIFGAHLKCAADHAAHLAGLKAAMTTPQWFRFRWRQILVGQKRMWSTFASRWSSSPKMVD